MLPGGGPSVNFGGPACGEAPAAPASAPEAPGAAYDDGVLAVPERLLAMERGLAAERPLDLALDERAIGEGRAVDVAAERRRFAHRLEEAAVRAERHALQLRRVLAVHAEDEIAARRHRGIQLLEPRAPPGRRQV